MHPLHPLAHLMVTMTMLMMLMRMLMRMLIEVMIRPVIAVAMIESDGVDGGRGRGDVLITKD